MVKLKIDNFEVEVPEGTSILEAARQAQIDIPTLCKHPDVDPSAGCGMCIVKVNGRILNLFYLFILYYTDDLFSGLVSFLLLLLLMLFLYELWCSCCQELH